MPWKPLPADAPLDDETLTPPAHLDRAAVAAPIDNGGSFRPLPDDAQLDPAPEGATEAPIIISAIRSGGSPRSAAALKAAGDEGTKSEEVNPSYTEAGFDVQPDTQHSGLTEADKAEYRKFFADPKNPPKPAMLRQWYHAKTGALMGNADQIAEFFAHHGKFSTTEKIAIPAPKATGSAQSYLEHTANAGTFDYGPEVAAALASLGIGNSLDGSGQKGPNIWNSDDQSLMNLWKNNADLLHARLDTEQEQHPWWSLGGELTGAAGVSPVVGAVTAPLADMESVGEGNRALLQTAGEGAAYGSGAAGPGHRLEGASVGAALAPAVGTVAKLPVAAVDVGKTVLQGSPGLARRIIAKAIKEDLNTPASVGSDIAASQTNDVPMAIADTGENTRGLLAAASRSSGIARTIARDALTERQAALADRVTGAIQRDLGPVANPHEIADQLMTKAKADAGPLYDAAYARPGAQTFGNRIAPLLQRPSMQKAIGKAYQIAQEEGRDPETLGFNHDPETGETTIKKVPSWQTLDYVKRGLDDVIEGYRDPTSGRLNLDTQGRAINNTQRAFLKAFDGANPDYGAARAAYAGPVKGIAAMNTGRKFLNMTADDVEARVRDMSPFEKQMAALGTRRAMAELVASKGDNADVVNALVGTGKKRAMLARLFGDRKTFQRFVDTLGQEREGVRTFKQALTGSPTAANLQDDGALQTATMAAHFMTGGALAAPAAISKSIKFLGIKLGEKAQQQIAAMLSNTDPAAIRELAAELRAQADKRGLRIRRVNDVTSAVGKSSIGFVPRQLLTPTQQPQ